MATKKTETTSSKESVKKSSLTEKSNPKCCKERTNCSATTKPESLGSATSTLFSISGISGTPTITRITVKYDVGFNNHLSLRGNGANLSWEKGILLKNTKRDEWVWETTTPFSMCEFKVLINDTHYESGDNHKIKCGGSVNYSPKF